MNLLFAFAIVHQSRQQEKLAGSYVRMWLKDFMFFFLNLLFINFCPFEETKYIDKKLDHMIQLAFLCTYVILRHNAKKMENFSKKEEFA